jgi:hypothetical protein
MDLRAAHHPARKSSVSKAPAFEIKAARTSAYLLKLYTVAG